MDEMESYTVLCKFHALLTPWPPLQRGATGTPGPLVPPTSAAGQEREPKKHVVGSFLKHPISKRDGNRESTEQCQTRARLDRRYLLKPRCSARPSVKRPNTFVYHTM